jgi:capsid protein
MNLALKYAFFLEADPQTDLMRDVFQANLEHGETRKDDYGESLVDLQDWNKLYYDQFKTKFDSVDIPQLTPGEKINVLSPHQNALNAHGMIQDNVFILAKIFGLSQESLTGDFRNSNYSSARLSEALTWEGIKAKREASVNVDATTIFKGWADEMMLRGLLPLLPTRVNYWEKRDILLNCDWIGAGKIIIDENKYASSVKTMLECNVTTLRDVLNEQGKDLDEVLEQLAFEELRKSELGIKDENGQTTNQFFDVVGA